jgi:hypothetical protein
MTSRSFEAVRPEGMGLTQPEYEAAWAAELSYLNAQVLAAIGMLQAAEHPPVIVVMSDHGYVYQANPDDLQSRFGNLFAAYTPGAPGLLKPAPTPVNLMPTLFNHYLAMELRLAPDRYFVSASDEKPLLLAEVRDPERVPSGISAGE